MDGLLTIGAQVVIRITDIPKGEAPQHIRQQWIGAELPARVTAYPGEGILTGRITDRSAGVNFRVEFDQACCEVIG